MADALFRVDQVTPGAGTPGRSRHDLVAGEIVTLVATSPTGPGVSYAWEILDKVGSNATLSASTGASVTIGNAGAIVAPCGFLVRLTVNDNGTVRVTERECTVRAPVTGLRPLLFTERAASANRFGSNDPDLSTDNAEYADLAGTGISGQNWRGYAQPYWEMLQVIEGLGGGGFFPTGPAGGDLAGTYPNPTVDGLRGRAVAATAPTADQVLGWNAVDERWEPTTLATDALVRAIGFDDMDEAPGSWRVVEVASGGTWEQSKSLTALGFPSAGAFVLKASTTPGAKRALVRTVGLAFDADNPIVIEHSVSVLDAGAAVSDDECTWAAGLVCTDGTPLAVVGVDGAHTLRTNASSESITLPSWTQRLRIRLTVSATGTLVEAAADDGAFVVVENVATAPTPGVYLPYLRIEKGALAGDRRLVVDYCRWSATRAADSVGSYVTDTETVTVPTSDHGSLSGLADDDHPQYLKLVGGTMTGALAMGANPITTSSTVDGRSVAADGTKLDGIEAAADVTDAANVAAAGAVMNTRAVLAGGVATGGGALSADCTITVTSGSPVAVARANADGSGTAVALANHVHDGGAITVSAKKTADFTLAVTDEHVRIDTTSGVVNVQMPSPALRKWLIQKVGGGTNKITLLRASGEKINEVAASYDLPGSATAFASATPQAWYVYGDGTDWYVA